LVQGARAAALKPTKEVVIVAATGIIKRASKFKEFSSFIGRVGGGQRAAEYYGLQPLRHRRYIADAL
jgi:hypothetical protein